MEFVVFFTDKYPLICQQKKTRGSKLNRLTLPIKNKVVAKSAPNLLIQPFGKQVLMALPKMKLRRMWKVKKNVFQHECRASTQSAPSCGTWVNRMTEASAATTLGVVFCHEASSESKKGCIVLCYLRMIRLR